MTNRFSALNRTMIPIVACTIFGGAHAASEPTQKAPGYERGRVAILQQECTLADWRYRLRIGTKGLSESLPGWDVLIKAPMENSPRLKQRYPAGDISVRYCGREAWTCRQATAASLLLRMRKEGIPSAGALTLQSPGGMLTVYRFRIQTVPPKSECAAPAPA